AWNGLAMSALALGGRVFAEPRWIEAAERTARFVLGPLRSGGRLRRSYTAGRAAHVGGFLSDHAFVTQGLIDLYEATFEPRWLEAAVAIAGATEERFADPDAGGWFATASDGEPLIAREKPTRDGAEPSGASVATLNALRLAAFTVDERWRRIADGALRAHAHTLESFPIALAELLLAVDFSTDAVREVALVWPEGEPSPEPFLRVLRETFLPSRALAGAPEGAALEALGGLVLFVREKRAAGRATAYVCEQGICRLPAIDPEKLRSQIEPVRPLR
ncbi:MAG: thioredoxin domain-containing protein, partial [Anaeromyxobacteraceae bacterium]